MGVSREKCIYLSAKRLIMLSLSSRWLTLLRNVVYIMFAASFVVSARRIGDCIKNGGEVECVTCDALVTVNPSTGQDCSEMVRNNRSLNGLVCDRLVDTIESIASGHTSPQRRSDPLQSCVAVDVYPMESGAVHVIRGLPVGDQRRIVISTNVVFRGVVGGSTSGGGRSKRQSRGRIPPEPTTTQPPSTSPPPMVAGQPPVVKFESAVGGEADEARYVLQFRESQFVAFKSIQFVGTTGILGAELISLMAVEDCSFSGFIQGALDVFNCPTVIVRTSNFSGNGFAATIKSQSYRGHAGAISIAYIQDSPPPYVVISNCSFYNNSADQVTSDPRPDNTMEQGPTPSNSFATSMRPPSRGTRQNELQAVRGGVIADQSFPGRGGGVALIFSVNRTSVRALIEDCLFLENAALALGGGLYVLLDGLSNHTVIINRTKFIGNVSPSTAGGLQITYLQEGQVGRVHQVLVEYCTFRSNQASYGGAVFFLPLTINVSALDDGELGIFAHFKNCLFTENSAVEVGGAFGVAFYILARSARSVDPLQFIDCEFTHNTVVGGGVVSTAYFPLSFRGSNVFSFNQGPSLAVVGSIVRLYGDLLFANNSNTGSLDGGALYVTSLGQMELKEGATLSFINNSGTLGAAIVVQNPPLHANYVRLLYNPLCSVIHSDDQLPPDLWNASIIFSSNQAVVAAAVFMNNLDFCSWTRLSSPFFNTSRVFRWNFVNFPEASPNVNSGHVSEPANQSYSVQTPAVNLKIVEDQVIAFPGQTFGLGAFAIDELGVATSALFTLSDDSIVTLDGSQDENGELYRFTPSSLNLMEVGPSTLLDVSLRIRRDSRVGRRELAVAKMISDNRKFGTITDAFNVASRPCPPGRKLLGMGDFSECMCDSADNDIISCNGQRVNLEEHLWGTAVDPGMGVAADNLLVTVDCPGSYCQCSPLNTSGVLKCTNTFDPGDPDAQCHCNRTGALCGDCVEGTGFSALLDRCVSCSDANSAFIVGLIVVDSVTILILLALSKPIPLAFYPFLFYLQLLPHFTTHFPVSFEHVRPYLAFVSSAMGLYFPYDLCLYDEASALVTYTFRYIPLLVAVVLSPLAVCFRKKRSPRDSWHGVWWLIMLLYTPAVHTSLSILHCPSFPVQDFNTTSFSTDPRWFINGNIPCFTGAHIPLGLFAIVVLFFSFSLVPLLFLVAFSEEKQLSRRPRWFELAVAAFQQSYKYWWWAPLELFRRFVLVILSISFPRNDFPVIFALSLFIGFTSFVKPYGNRESHRQSRNGLVWAVNVLDLFLASNILILLLLRNTQYIEDNYEDLPLVTATSLSFTTVQDSCDDGRGLTAFAIILTPLCYLPLLLAVSTFLVWLCRLLITTAVKKYRDYKNERRAGGEGEENGIELRLNRGMTRSVIDPRTYNPEEFESPIMAPLQSSSIAPRATVSRTPSLSLQSWIYRLGRRDSSRKKMKEKESVDLQVKLEGVQERNSDKQNCDMNDQGESINKGQRIEDNNDQRSSCISDNSYSDV